MHVSAFTPHQCMYIYGSVLVNEMPKSARYHIDRANSIVFTSKRLPLQPVSSERNHQVVRAIYIYIYTHIYMHKTTSMLFYTQRHTEMDLPNILTSST